MNINPLAAAIMANTQPQKNNAASQINKQMNAIGEPLTSTVTASDGGGVDLSSLFTLLMMMLMGNKGKAAGTGGMIGEISGDSMSIPNLISMLTPGAAPPR